VCDVRPGDLIHGDNTLVVTRTVHAQAPPAAATGSSYSGDGLTGAGFIAGL